MAAPQPLHGFLRLASRELVGRITDEAIANDQNRGLLRHTFTNGCATIRDKLPSNFSPDAESSCEHHHLTEEWVIRIGRSACSRSSSVMPTTRLSWPTDTPATIPTCGVHQSIADARSSKQLIQRVHVRKPGKLYTKPRRRNRIRLCVMVVLDLNTQSAAKERQPVGRKLNQRTSQDHGARVSNTRPIQLTPLARLAYRSHVEACVVRDHRQSADHGRGILQGFLKRSRIPHLRRRNPMDADVEVVEVVDRVWWLAEPRLLMDHLTSADSTEAHRTDRSAISIRRLNIECNEVQAHKITAGIGRRSFPSATVIHGRLSR